MLKKYAKKILFSMALVITSICSLSYASAYGEIVEVNGTRYEDFTTALIESEQYENAEIKLFSDVYWSHQVIVKLNNVTTIDLNGYSAVLRHEEVNNQSFVIVENTLNIVDTSDEKKGSIECYGTCIANSGKVTIDGVKVTAHNGSVVKNDVNKKTDENSILIIKDSEVISDATAITNVGSVVRISASKITSTGKEGIAIDNQGIFYEETPTAFHDSMLIAENSIIDAPIAISAKRGDEERTWPVVELHNVTIESGIIDLYEGATFSTDTNETLLNALTNAHSGASLYLNKDFEIDSLEINKGVILGGDSIMMDTNDAPFSGQWFDGIITVEESENENKVLLSIEKKKEEDNNGNNTGSENDDKDDDNNKDNDDKENDSNDKDKENAENNKPTLPDTGVKTFMLEAAVIIAISTIAVIKQKRKDF